MVSICRGFLLLFLCFFLFLSANVEVYPNSNGCSLPPLPKPRLSPATFLTAGPNPVIATCGGDNVGESCLVLDPSNHRWDDSMMGDLRYGRSMASSGVARLNSLGVYILGDQSSGTITDFLAAGTMQWKNGPFLPWEIRGDMMSFTICAVTISETSFLAIRRTDIREFDASISGPTSEEGWREAGRWPSLKTMRISSPGCTKLGQKVIIAGGFKRQSTEVLDLQTREITSGGPMAQPRMWFHSGVIIGSGGRETLFAFGGEDDKGGIMNAVEEWVEESGTWKAAKSLAEPKAYYGATVAPKEIVCPV